VRSPREFSAADAQGQYVQPRMPNAGGLNRFALPLRSSLPLRRPMQFRPNARLRILLSNLENARPSRPSPDAARGTNALATVASPK
jgi:hypothetical protein